MVNSRAHDFSTCHAIQTSGSQILKLAIIGSGTSVLAVAHRPGRQTEITLFAERVATPSAPARKNNGLLANFCVTVFVAQPGRCDRLAGRPCGPQYLWEMAKISAESGIALNRHCFNLGEPGLRYQLPAGLKALAADRCVVT
jgi:hypothetical protein